MATAEGSARHRLQSLAEEAREIREREVEADNHDHLKGQCHVNAVRMADVLDDAGIPYEFVVGVLVGDSIMNDAAEQAYLSAPLRDEHDIDRVPAVVDDAGMVLGEVDADRISDVGVVHVWVEVDGTDIPEAGDETWIVEPFAEMRGQYEYEAVATPVRPLDYVYVSDRDISEKQVRSLIDEDGQAGTLNEALFRD